MNKVFYASGFLYNESSQQILLQHNSDTADTTLSLFTGKGSTDESPALVFQRTILEETGIKLPLSGIHSIYDYTHKELGKTNFIVYAMVGDSALKIKKQKAIGWYQLKQLSKLRINEQIKQDIIVGQRVIRQAERSKLELEEQKSL